VDVFQGLIRSLSKLRQVRAVSVRSLATSSLNTFVRDKSYVNGKWVSASSGKTFDGDNICLSMYLCHVTNELCVFV